HVQDAGLPGPAGADERDELAPGHVEGDPAEGGHARVGDPVDLVHVLQAHERVPAHHVAGAGEALPAIERDARRFGGRRAAHSASPGSTVVTGAARSARAASARPSPAVATTAAAKTASARQSRNRSGGGNAVLTVAARYGIISRSSTNPMPRAVSRAKAMTT